MWAGFNERQFKLQCCKACGHWWFPPGPACPDCLSQNWEFKPVCGKGRVVAWTRFHKQYFESMPAPYLVVSVQLDEGPLVIGNLMSLNEQMPTLDLPVKLTFEEVSLKGVPSLLPQWIPV
jgi:uncharacterized OB-fold protein